MNRGQIPGIPPGVRSEELVTTLNDRLRKVSDALGSVAASAAAAGSVATAYASAALTLVAVAYNNILGATLTLQPGRYLITGCFDFLGAGVGDVGVGATGRLLAGGIAQTGLAEFQMLVLTGPVLMRATVAQQWAYTANAAVVVQLQAQKSGGTGTSQAQTNTSIAAVLIPG